MVRTPAKKQHQRKMRRLIATSGAGPAGGPVTRGIGAVLSLRQAGKASPADARSHNRSLVLQTIYLQGPLSRAAIARATGLTKVTVSDLVAELLSEGLLEELGTDGQQRTGKPAVLVDLARGSFNLIVADLSEHDSFKGALLDLNTEPIVSLEFERSGAQGEEAVELAVRLISELKRIAQKPVLGVGIGSPGIVDSEGTVHTAPNLEWTDVPLGQIARERTGLPVLVTNDANAAALAEYAFGEEPGDLIFVSIGHGVGAGLIVSGQLVLGTRWAAGEIGQVMVGTDLGLSAPYSRDQILEHWVSVPSLTERVDGASHTETERVLTEAGQRLGVALAPVVGALNFKRVIIGGPEELLGTTLAQSTFDTIRSRTMPDSHEELVVHASALGPDNVLYGCAAMTIAEVLGTS